MFFFGFYELEDINTHLGYEGSRAKKFLTKIVIKLTLGLNLPYENYPTVADDLPTRMNIYKRAIKKLAKPGLNHFFMHAAHAVSSNGEEIPDGKHHPPGIDDVVRQADLAVWSSQEMKQFLSDQNIFLINYTAPQGDSRFEAEESRN